ncbi:MAG: fibrobacter succinogenes major paralogous domain-containing protein [Saprospiraceae bacterium]
MVTPPAPSFTCGTTTITDIDLNSYSTVSIGAQCWTTTNLKVTKYNDGTLIPDLTTSTSNPWAPTSGARTGYNVSVVSLSDYVGTFGYLYNWYAVTDSRKLCPDGWRVPTDAEWTIMIQDLDPFQVVNSGNVLTFNGVQSTTAGTALKSQVTNTTAGSGLGWNPGSPGTNTSGFSALPGGYRRVAGSFSNVRNFAYFWSATENVTDAWNRELNYNSGVVYRYSDYKSVGASVRCLRD